MSLFNLQKVFQFHKVRLKECVHKEMQFGKYSFNSIRFD